MSNNITNHIEHPVIAHKDGSPRSLPDFRGMPVAEFVTHPTYIAVSEGASDWGESRRAREISRQQRNLLEREFVSANAHMAIVAMGMAATREVAPNDVVVAYTDIAER